VKKGKPPFKLLLLLAVVAGVIWYLNGY